MNEKRKVKGAKGRIASKIIALIMLVFMVIASCSTAIYYLINYFTK